MCYRIATSRSLGARCSLRRHQVPSMLFGAAYSQLLDPLNNRLFSTLFAAAPVVVLFWLLVPRRWLASKAAAGGAVTAILIAWLAYGMPLHMAGMAFIDGALFGLLPV